MSVFGKMPVWLVGGAEIINRNFHFEIISATIKVDIKLDDQPGKDCMHFHNLPYTSCRMGDSAAFFL